MRFARSAPVSAVYGATGKPLSAPAGAGSRLTVRVAATASPAAGSARRNDLIMVCSCLVMWCRGGRTDSEPPRAAGSDRKSTRLNSSHVEISYAVFCLKKKKKKNTISSIEKKKQNYQ